MSDVYVTEHNNHISITKTANEVSILSPGTVGPQGGAGEISSATATATAVAVDGNGVSQDPTVAITLGGTPNIRTMAFAFGLPTGASGAGVVYKEAWAASTSYVHRDLVRYTDNNLYFCKVAHTSATNNNPTVEAAKWALFINADDAYQWATKAKHTQITDSLSQTGYSALHQAGKAQDWATLTTDAVTNDANGSDVDYSAKAWAIGGTEVTQTASRGAAKEWAIGTGRIDDQSSGEYSAKEYATGTTATSAKKYATKVDGAVTGTDFSSKAWAVGGTDVTNTSTRGSAKDWAIGGGGTMSTKADNNEYSAKQYAIGVTAPLGSAKQWATTAEDQVVASGLYSSNHYMMKAKSAKESAEAALATFQSLFHGASTSTPSSNVSDGDLWFDTNTGVNAMKVYNADTSAWEQLAPTGASQTNINTLTTKYDGTTNLTSGDNLNIAQVDTVADNIANVNKVGVIDSDVTKVAAIGTNGADVTTVANIGTDGADVTTVAGKATEIGRLGTDAMAHASTGHLTLLGTATCVEDMAFLGSAATVADMALLGTSDCVADMAMLADSDVIADMNTLATSDIVSDLNTLATSDIVADLNTLATSDIVSDLETVADNIASVNNFADLYQISDFTENSGAGPNTDGGSNAVAEGDLAYDSTANRLKYYDGSAWADATGVSLSQVQTEANNASVAMSIALG